MIEAGGSKTKILSLEDLLGRLQVTWAGSANQRTASCRRVTRRGARQPIKIHISEMACGLLFLLSPASSGNEYSYFIGCVCLIFESNLRRTGVLSCYVVARPYLPTVLLFLFMKILCEFCCEPCNSNFKWNMSTVYWLVTCILVEKVPSLPWSM